MSDAYASYPLNGDWMMDYLSAEPYTSSSEPPLEGFPVRNAIPGYWEDMLDEFRASPLHTKLRWNPLYTLQRYPQAGYVPDMALPNVTGCMSYIKSFHLDSVPEGEIILHFGGAQNAVSAWINGQFLGRHEGYSAAFFFPVPAAALHAGENRITLAVSNLRLRGYMDRPISGCTSRAANECTGGVYGDVELRVYAGPLHEAWVTTDIPARRFTLHLDAAADRPGKVRILDGTRPIVHAEIPAGENQITLSLGRLTRWTPDCPKRYTAEITCGAQKFTHVFGLRQLTTEGRILHLNGAPFYARGICEHGYYPLTVHPPRDKQYYRKVIRTIKELGFNFIRFHTWVPMAEYMEAADELGILMEIETPNNTTEAEWAEIMRHCRRYTAPTIYSSGNEMVIDEDYIKHLSRCAKLIHSGSDSLFSPMSAMRGIEYFSYGDCREDDPFPHNPVRLNALWDFSDLYNSYSLGLLSYHSDQADHAVLDARNAIYHKPILSHEICINGTYCDLSLKDRYRNTRIGDTELFTSVERHLEEKGLLSRANLYYRNSCQWQRLLRKACFEMARRSKTIAGYDYLGDIDHHWHTFGYCVGMMNEFYELKPGETRENVLRYNSDTVLLADLPDNVSLTGGDELTIPLLASHFGKYIDKATLRLRLTDGKRVLFRKEMRVGCLLDGQLTELYRAKISLPRCMSPRTLTLTAQMSGGDTDAENQWNLYLFPPIRTAPPTSRLLKTANLTITEHMDAHTLLHEMESGCRVLLLGAGPFAAVDTSFQISLAGRTEGHLATVINDVPLMEDFPHEGYCGFQCRAMLNGGHSVLLDHADIPYQPVIEIASSYKNVRREALLFGYRVGNGVFLCCPMNLNEDDPAACWLKARMIHWMVAGDFSALPEITPAQLTSLFARNPHPATQNANEAMNKNDVTM